MKTLPTIRSSYHVHRPIQTRWHDNDIYGHVNNVVYYSYFDTAINAYLIECGGLDLDNSQVIGLCVESQCRYFAPAGFPEPLSVGLRVGHLGRSSVRYEIGIFNATDEQALADGHFVHVFVERVSRRPAPLPDALRVCLAGLLASAGGQPRPG